MKTCARCNKPLDERKFYKNDRHRDGLQYSCIDCQKGYQKTWRERHKEYSKNYQRHYYLTKNQYRRKAQRAFARALKAGKIQQLPWCQICGQAAGPKVTYAYQASGTPEYWLDVIWLCAEHRKALQVWLRREKYP